MIGNTCRVGQARAGERRPTNLQIGISRSLGGWTLRALFPPYVLFVIFTGCGVTQLSSSNRHLLEALQTAVSAKNDQWLDGVAKQIEEQHAKAQMSHSEYKEFTSIIQTAKSGNWDNAQSRVFALSEGQRPTPDDLARVQKRVHK